MNQNGEVVLLPAKRYAVWSRLYQRFLLEPAPAVGSNAFVAPVIQPITDADKLLQRSVVETITTVINNQATFVIVTVPKGERWTLSIWNTRKSTGTWTHNFFSTQGPEGSAMTVHTYTPTTGTELWEPRLPLVLDEGWQLKVNADSHSVDGNMISGLLVLKEDAF